MNRSGKYRWLRTVTPFAVVYFLVGVAFPNPPASNPTQFAWRLAAWLICALAFALHIGLEHFRLRNSPFRTALHASLSVALAAFAIAAAANIHARTAGFGNERQLALALAIWPVATGLPAFAVAFAVAAGLAQLRPNKSQPRTGSEYTAVGENQR